MDYDRARKEIRERWEDIIRQTTSPAKEKVRGRTSYICPLCGHGKNGDGLTINPKSKDGKGLKCFGCGFSGDVIDLVGEVEGIPDYPSKLKRAGEYLGIDVQARSSDPKPAQSKPEGKRGTHMNIQTDTYTHEDTHEEKSLVPYYRECQKHLPETDYHTRRGISEEVAHRFMLGFIPSYRVFNNDAGRWEEWRGLLIPTGHSSYVVRNTDPKATKGNRYRNKGQATPLNWKALESAQKPIYIVEGELDALSIIEVGGEAIGLGSAENIDRFIRDYVKKYPPAQPLVIALDNDEKGQKATKKLEEELTELGVAFFKINPAGEHKDANEALTADREAFAKAVEQAEIAQEEALEAEREEYRKTSAYNHLQEFIDGIAESANTPVQPTGFTGLDDLLDGGLYEGLYVIGAISSLGKTTLALQIADQIADSGRDVLIFSLEMARSELMSKSISRQTLLDVLENGGEVSNAKTNRGITAGAKYQYYSQIERDLIQRAIKAYGDYAQHIYIHEGIGDIGTDYIRETVERHRRHTGQAPVVLIDYIQILAPYNVRATDKQNMDKAVLELKRISREYKIPVIGVSSVNRNNYLTPIDFESFKESGAVEFTADVVIGLQLACLEEDLFNSSAQTKVKEKRERIQKAKAEDPRKIQLVILKNRNGKTGDRLGYEYYPLFNYFKEAREKARG